LYQNLYKDEVQIVIDVDLSSYFDSIDHKQLLAFLKIKIRDGRFLRYITRILKSGVLSEGELTVSEEGVPQGSICSPILANIFAHYVIDEWFEDVVKEHCSGKVELYRYADDAVICCQYEKDSKRILSALINRLEKYGLKLNEEKSRLVSFSRRHYTHGIRQGAFDFLGFTFYLGRSRKGTSVPKVKSIGKRLRVKLKRVNEWARAVRSRYKLAEIWRIFCAKLEGHVQYYGVSFNVSHVQKFIHLSKRILFRWLNRRSQRRSFNWGSYLGFMERNPLPRARVCHTLF
jgi:group II intron reverse transcriptase/maturase